MLHLLIALIPRATMSSCIVWTNKSLLMPSVLPKHVHALRASRVKEHLQTLVRSHYRVMGSMTQVART